MKRIVCVSIILLVFSAALMPQDRIIDFEAEIKRIKDRVSPSVVKVIAENHKRYVATGIAIEENLVLTSALLLRYPYQKLYIHTVANRSIPATLLGKDRHHSIALLRLKGANLTPIRTADAPDVGDWIALVGVFADRFPSIFHGIVSSAAEDRLILNAPVFPGASGGAVVNKRGDLVAVIRGRLGVATEPDISVIDQRGEFTLRGQKLRNRTLCYAIPALKVMDIAEQLRKYGRVRRGWLGVHLSSWHAGPGAVIFGVQVDSPASHAGLRRGDQIVAIDGFEIKKPADLVSIVRSLKPGITVSLSVKRGEEIDGIRVKLGEQPERENVSIATIRFPDAEPRPLDEFQAAMSAPEWVFDWRSSGRLGVEVLEMTPKLAVKFHIADGHGLMLSRVYRQGAASRAGLEEGDIVVRAAGVPVKTLFDLRHALSNQAEGREIPIDFFRDGKRLSRSLIPDSNRSEGWQTFTDRVRGFTDRFLDRFLLASQKTWRREKQVLRERLRVLKSSKERIPEQALRQIEEKISAWETAYRLFLQRQLHQVLEKQRMLQAEQLRFQSEGEGLRRELDALKKRIDTGNDGRRNPRL